MKATSSSVSWAPRAPRKRGAASSAGKVAVLLAVATLGGLYSEGAFRRGGIGDRACDRVGVLSRVVGEHRHVIFIARRRGGSSRRAVGACQVSVVKTSSPPSRYGRAAFL